MQNFLFFSYTWSGGELFWLVNQLSVSGNPLGVSVWGREGNLGHRTKLQSVRIAIWPKDTRSLHPSTSLSKCSVSICVDLLWSNSKCVFMGMYFYIYMYLVIQECIQGYQITLFWVFNSCSRDSQEPRPSCSRLGLQSGTGEPEPSLLLVIIFY